MVSVARTKGLYQLDMAMWGVSRSCVCLGEYDCSASWMWNGACQEVCANCRGDAIQCDCVAGTMPILSHSTVIINFSVSV